MQNELLQVLTREGVLVNVSVRYWRAHKKLKAEDIGLKPDAVSDRLISLGHKRLLPKEATAALALVEASSCSRIITRFCRTQIQSSSASSGTFCWKVKLGKRR
jgi:hypothetical protein